MVSKSNSKSPSRKKLGRKGTMDQVVADGKNFLENGTYDEEATGRRRALGKRKIIPVYDEDVWVTGEDEPKKKKQKVRSVSPAPRAKKNMPSSPSPKTTKTKKSTQKPRSQSPKKTTARVTRSATKANTQTTTTSLQIPASAAAPPITRTPAVIPPPPSASQLPIKWEFKSGKPAFGVHVSLDRVWMANDAGDMYGFTSSGKLERHIKLPSGIKTIVADMGFWLYAGCDDGVVYDLSHETEPRIAYHFKETTFDQNQTTEPLKDPMINDAVGDATAEVEIELPKARHIVFAIDTSSSMAGGRIAAVIANLRMIYEHNIRDDDLISLITFSTAPNVLIHRLQKGKKEDDHRIRNIIFGAGIFASGSTAFWDAIALSYDEFVDNDDEEQWIIALTDGEDNQSKHHGGTIAALASRKRANVIMVLVDDVSRKYQSQMQQVCQVTKEGMLIYVNPNAYAASAGVTSAFKQIAQLLSSKIMWMDIRDGLLSVSDNKGRLCACSIEGTPIWQQQSVGNCGWMVRTDFEGVYHGHSKGVTKYSPVDGKVLWHKSLLDRVLFGWLDKRTNRLYVGAGNIVYIINCEQGNQIVSCICDSTVSSTAASFGSEFVFAGDILGNVYCFDGQGTQVWRIKSNRGTPLSMHYHEPNLYMVTSEGSLLCVDVSADAIAKAQQGAISAPLLVDIPKDMVVTKPITDLPETQDASGLIIEIYQQFTDTELIQIHNAIHDPAASLVTVGGREYGIEIHSNGCRCVKIDGISYIEQNQSSNGKYAEMAAKGQKITWVCNGRRWGLVVNGVVQNNGTPLLARLLKNDKGFDVCKPIQFPKNYRKKGAKYAVDDLAPSENDEFYRVKGSIKILKEL